ncbi:MAG: gamma-butyrobetaine hydroxylase-like domain-containing protein [Gammaproteobacteria bacterium]
MTMSPTPTEIKLLQKKRLLEITFDDGKHFELPCAYLRAHSPSADKTVSPDIQNVTIIGIDPVGQYAVKLIFDDGHSTGLYSWEKLYTLGLNFE